MTAEDGNAEHARYRDCRRRSRHLQGRNRSLSLRRTNVSQISDAMAAAVRTAKARSHSSVVSDSCSASEVSKMLLSEVPKIVASADRATASLRPPSQRSSSLSSLPSAATRNGTDQTKAMRLCHAIHTTVQVLKVMSAATSVLEAYPDDFGSRRIKTGSGNGRTAHVPSEDGDTSIDSLLDGSTGELSLKQSSGVCGDGTSCPRLLRKGHADTSTETGPATDVPEEARAPVPTKVATLNEERQYNAIRTSHADAERSVSVSIAWPRQRTVKIDLEDDDDDDDGGAGKLANEGTMTTGVMEVKGDAQRGVPLEVTDTVDAEAAKAGADDAACINESVSVSSARTTVHISNRSKERACSRPQLAHRSPWSMPTPRATAHAASPSPERVLPTPHLDKPEATSISNRQSRPRVQTDSAPSSRTKDPRSVRGPRHKSVKPKSGTKSTRSKSRPRAVSVESILPIERVRSNVTSSTVRKTGTVSFQRGDSTPTCPVRRKSVSDHETSKFALKVRDESEERQPRRRRKKRSKSKRPVKSRSVPVDLRRASGRPNSRRSSLSTAVAGERLSGVGRGKSVSVHPEIPNGSLEGTGSRAEVAAVDIECEAASRARSLSPSSRPPPLIPISPPVSVGSSDREIPMKRCSRIPPKLEPSPLDSPSGAGSLSVRNRRSQLRAR